VRMRSNETSAFDSQPPPSVHPPISSIPCARRLPLFYPSPNHFQSIITKSSTRKTPKTRFPTPSTFTKSANS
jgi:hypothetical protein